MFAIGQLAIAQAARAFLSFNVVVGLALLLIASSHSTAAHSDYRADACPFQDGFKSSYTVLTDTWSDSGEKRYVIRPIIPAHFYKFHFIFALGMFFFIALIVVSPSTTARALLLLPVVLCYGIAHILFAADQAEMVGLMMERYKLRLQKREERR
jgi:hypothetical protein